MTTSATTDAIVIGAGHQGLVAGLYLARAGWNVTVVEGQDEVGGATRSAELTEPGLVHDVYATNLNLFLASPVFAELSSDLARAGFSPATSKRPYANVFPHGDSLRIYSDVARTERELGERNPKDLAGWHALRGIYDDLMSAVMPIYGTRLPSTAALRVALRAVRRLGPRRLLEVIGVLMGSTRELADRWFVSAEARALMACWGMHLDFGPDVSGGAMFPLVETFADMDAGMSVAAGGMGRLPEALTQLLREAGGEVLVGAPVTQVTTDARGRADGVLLEDGRRVGARRAVIATTTPTALYRDLLSTAKVPDDVRRKAEQFAYGPGSLMVHLATDGPIPWTAHPDLQDFAYVHVGPYVDDLARTYQQAMAGLIPDRPMLVVGQTSRVDPSRSPDHREVVWIQVRCVPSRIRGDSAGEITSSDWTTAKERVADRVVSLLEEHAPGFRDLIRSRVVLSPDDLERANPNLVGGDAGAGSHHLSQNFLFRPWVGASSYRTAVPRLHLAGASTWPGGGTNAGSGYLLARSLVASSSRRNQLWRP